MSRQPQAVQIELIDTLWNVNTTGKEKQSNQVSELIDTLWNVNKDIRNYIKRHRRINRYIMECKYWSRYTTTDVNDELIDTLWNVN